MNIRSRSIGTSTRFPEQSEKLNGHAGCVVWFTGLSACGKSTVANLVDHKLHSLGVHSFVLDGDNIRHGLNAGPAMLKEQHGEEFAKRFGLGFSAQDREENIRRIGAVAKLFSDAGVDCYHCFHQPLSGGPRPGPGRFAPTATSSRSSSMPRSRYAKHATPRASTRRPGPGNSRVLRASTTPTNRRSSRNWCWTPPKVGRAAGRRGGWPI